MRPIRIAFAAFVASLIAVWLTSDTLLANAADGRAQAMAFTQFTGLLALGMMAFANLLSARPRWLEPPLGGLDKMYRLHKWLGVGGLLLAVVHWLTHAGTGRGVSATDAAVSAAPAWISSLKGPAMAAVTPSLFLLIALVAVALVRLVPYRIFARTHVLTVPLFAYFAFHSVVMMKAGYWAAPAGWLTIILALVGTVSGIIGLMNFFGLRRVSRGEVLSSHYFPELHVLETTLQLDRNWPGHEAGQFAFVTTDAREGAHPFTIATAWHPEDCRIGFIAKELGDHTAKLRENFAVGRRANVQGPYGRFTFDDGKPRQIWVGGGIGITPFIARMRALQDTGSTIPVDLFHATKEVSAEALAKLRADATAAGIALHISIDGRDGLLGFGRIASAVPGWKDASIWVCGPTGLGNTLRRDFVANGLSPGDFHQELFEMR